MSTNLDRFKADLERLIDQSTLLDHVMVRIVVGEEEFRKQLKNALKTKDKIDAFISKLPKFEVAYEAWYSESLSLLKQILPDRVENFRSYYERPKNRKSVEYGNYVIQDFLQGLQVTYGGSVKVDVSAAVPQLRQQAAILQAAKTRFESSLYDIRQIVQADLFDSELSAARELLKNKFHRAAGIVSGVILEKHLKQVCSDHGIIIKKKNPSISDLNELLKSNEVIAIPQWRHVSFLSDIRNICGHDKDSEPTMEQVKDLIDGTEKSIKTVV
ncbi:hypothetical protein ACSHT0_02595 [Tepidicaulis sp. LMO-SS28]|uniref:hypothetical protein n=1 Tax=Tepidicaulis sp. LMO-SS28 TaxID=3447455 RepID=UPI003EE3339B